MKLFELTYLSAEPFLSPLHRQVRSELKNIAAAYQSRPQLLDVGGRKSHCTIGILADVTVTDLPRQSEIQKRLNLGVNRKITGKTLGRRSNIKEIVFDDMTRSSLPDSTFDVVVAVEVLEHVEEDSLFVAEVHRVLKPNGTFLMTTPNGDFLKVPFADHKRHYAREHLHSLLSAYFGTVKVQYAVRSSVFRAWGRNPWSLSRPIRTGASMLGNLVNAIQSAHPKVKSQPTGTLHLVATARKPSVVGDMRQLPRHKARLPLTVARQKSAIFTEGAEAPSSFSGHTVNISAGSLAFILPGVPREEFRPNGTAMILRMAMDAPCGTIRMFASATRREQSKISEAKSNYLIAARIVDMSRNDRARLNEYLCTIS